MTSFFQNRYVKCILFMSGGAAIAQICFVAATPLLTRLYLPDHYGHFASLMALTTIYSPIASLRYDFIYFKDKKKPDHYISACLISLAISLPVFILIYLIAYPNIFSNFDKLLLFAVSCTAGLLNLSSQFLIGSLEYSAFSRTKAIQGIIQVIVSLVLGLAGISSGLILSLLLAQILTTLLQFRVLKQIITISFDIRNGFTLFKKNIKVAITSTITTLLQYSTPIAPIFISMMYYTKADSGIYFFCAQLFSVPLSLVRRSLLNVITSELSEMNNARIKFTSLAHKTRKMWAPVSACTILIMTLVYRNGSSLFSSFFGQEWSNAGKVAWIILLMFLVDMVCQPISNMLTLWNEERKNLAIEFLRFCSVFILPITLINVIPLEFNRYVFIHCCAMISIYLLSSFITIRHLFNYEK